MNPPRSRGRHPWLATAAILSAWLSAAAILSGVAAIALAAVLARPRTSPVSWQTHLQWVDQALAANNVSAAAIAWRDASGAALGSREWEAMLAVGDAAIRIGEAAHGRRGFEPQARQSYLLALLRARQQGSFDGVLRSTEAFARLGDRDVVESGVRMAEGLAGLDSERQARVRALAAPVAAGFPVTTASDVGPY